MVRLVSAFVREVMMLSTRDSVFFDSPLSNTGIQQVRCVPSLENRDEPNRESFRLPVQLAVFFVFSWCSSS